MGCEPPRLSLFWSLALMPSMHENQANLVTAWPQEDRWTDCQYATPHPCQGFTLLCTACFFYVPICKELRTTNNKQNGQEK